MEWRVSFFRAYSSSTGRLPENIPPLVNGTKADLFLSLFQRKDVGLRKRIVKRLQEHLTEEHTKGVYIIADFAKDTLPYIAAQAFAPASIDSHVMLLEEGLSENARLRFLHSLWRNARILERGKPARPKGYATLIDFHRTYSLPSEFFPQRSVLNDIGVQRVIYMSQQFHGIASEEIVTRAVDFPELLEREPRVSPPLDVRVQLRRYLSSGISVSAVGVKTYTKEKNNS